MPGPTAQVSQMLERASIVSSHVLPENDTELQSHLGTPVTLSA